jgi:hypothetical protein
MAIPTPVRLHVGTVLHPTDLVVRWIAPTATGVGHAYPGRRFQPAACGGAPVDERFVFAVTSKCPDCLVIVGAEQVRLGQELGDEPPDVARQMWGK